METKFLSNENVFGIASIIYNNVQKKYNINITRLPEYKKKGEYMTTMFRSFCRPGEIGIPIDIDEFIVYYDKHTNKISCDGNKIFSVLKSLSPSQVYKMNYIFSKITCHNGYKNAVINTTNGTYLDYGSSAKSFFNKSLFRNLPSCFCMRSLN